MSDGLRDVLAYTPYSTVEFAKLYKQFPQAAADYLVAKAVEYSRGTHKENADDISALIVNI